MKSIVLWLQRLLLACLAIVVGMNCILLVKGLILKEELPSLAGYSVVTVMSGSMEPEFSPGDLLIIHKEPAYDVGDVITFTEEGALITHRLIEKSEEGYVTQGDANNAPDGMTVNAASVYGKVLLVIPKLGNVVIFSRSALGTLVLIVVFLVLMEVTNGSFTGKEKKKKQEQGPE